MKALTDEALALIGVNNAMQKLTVQLDHLTLAATKAHTHLLDVADVGQKMTQRGFLLDMLFGHTGSRSALQVMLGDTGSRGGGGGFGGGGGGGGSPSGPGFGGGPYFSRPPRVKSFQERIGPRGMMVSPGEEDEWFGKQTPFGAELSPEVMAAPTVGKLLRHGNVDTELLSKFHAHLSGGRKMGRKEFRLLLDQSRRPSADYEETYHAEREKLKLAREAEGKSLTAEDEQALRQPDKGRLARGHRRQLGQLYLQAMRHRAASAELMPQLAEDQALLSSPGGHHKFGGYLDTAGHPRREGDPKSRWEQAKGWAGGLWGKFSGKPPAAPATASPAAQAATQERASRAARGFGESLGETAKSLDKWGDRFRRFGDAGERVFKKGLLYGTAAAEAASPDAFSTLSGSWKLLMASVGEGLLEPTAELALSLQDLAGRFQGLDEGTKRTVGQVIVFGTVAAGAAMALRAVGLAGPLGSMAAGMGRSIWNVGTSGLGAGALTFGGIGAAAGLAYLAYSGYQRQRSEGADLISRMDSPITDEEFAAGGGPHVAAMRGLPAGDRARYMTLQSRDIGRRMERAQARLGFLEGTHNAEGRRLPWWRMQVLPMGSSEQREAARAEVASLHREHRNLVDAGRVAAGGTRAVTPQQRDSALLSGNRLLMDYVNKVQPSYLAVEDIHKKIQLEVLSESPLQQEIRQIQLRQLERLGEMSSSLRTVMERWGISGPRATVAGPP